MKVTLKRSTAHYRRARNGGWVGNGVTSDKHEVDESLAIFWIMDCGLSSWVDVEWPDGHREHFGRGTTIGGIHGPGNSRLRPYAAGPVYGDPESPYSAWYPEREARTPWKG